MDTPADRISVRLNIKFNEPITAFALQIGGFSPLAFSSASMILVDRNIVGMAKQIASGSGRHDVSANEWWFSFLNHKRYTLNPVLCAMEGQGQDVPSFHEFVAEFDEAMAIVVYAFPEASFVSYTDCHFLSAYSLVEELGSRYSSEHKFLLDVAPLIANRVADKDLSTVERQILEASAELHTGSSRLVVLAVLSCLYESSDGAVPNIGRKIVKPKPKYTPEAAHNVLSDLRALELLVQLSQVAGPEAAFVTCDRSLASFWCEIQASKIERTSPRLRFNVKLTKKLVPRLCEEGRNKLAKRLSRSDF